MSPIEIRQKLHRQIDQLPTDLLLLVDEFLEFLRFRRSKETDSTTSSLNLEIGADEPVLTGSTGADLLPFVGTWQGDDFEDCLQAVYETRSPAKF
jgi:hypothetical protein